MVGSNNINNLRYKKIKFRDLEKSKDVVSNLNSTQTWFESIHLDNLRLEYRSTFSSVTIILFETFFKSTKISIFEVIVNLVPRFGALKNQ